MSADIAVIGAGVMGAALSKNFAEKGVSVALYDRDAHAAKAAADEAKAEGLTAEIHACENIAKMLASTRSPRPVLLSIPADVVDSALEELAPLLDRDDMVIDAGNANFHDTRRRQAAVRFGYLGLGVSGGEEGARNGPALMAGGDPALWSRIEGPLKAIAAQFEGEPCCALLGSDGAGHFVKTIHNGIEYADMQMVAEVYGVMRDGLGMEAAAIGDVFAGWAEGPLASYLIEITTAVARESDPATGAPMLNVIADRAGQKGTGRWSVIEAQHLGAPASMIEAAVGARNISAASALRADAQAAFGPAANAMSGALGDDPMKVLEGALLAGKIAAYAQGFEIMRRASEAYDWRLDLAAAARIWRAGCIIRAALLSDIAAVFGADPAARLLAAPGFADMLRANAGSLRLAVVAATAHGRPVPALAAALSYLDQARAPRGTANMIQAQRDFFGRHGFERTDQDGEGFHGPWAD